MSFELSLVGSDLQLNSKSKIQNPKFRTLLFIAGDVSGDIHSALLIRAVLERHPGWNFFVMGGSQMLALAREYPNIHAIGDTTGCGVIGFASALALIPRSLNLRTRVLRFLRSHRVDGAVLCDWGAFNGRLLPQFKPREIPVLYYFPPRSWQKTGTGGLGIVPYITRVATPFEWSAQRLTEAGGQAEWVGHPLLETLRSRTSRAQLRQQFGVGEGEKLIALLPGSRAMELHYIAPHLVAAAQLLRARHSVTFVAAVPEGAAPRARPYFPDWIAVVEGRATDLLLSCDVAIVKSGTATLEAAVADAPQVIVYDVPPLLRAQWILTGLYKKVPFVGMPNIILERAVVPELLADACRAEPIYQATQDLLENEARCQQIRDDYGVIRRALGEGLPKPATQRTAEILEEMLALTRP